MGISVGTLPIVRLWQGSTIIRASSRGNQIFWPQGCGAVLNSSETLSASFQSSSYYYWSHANNEFNYSLHEGDPRLVLKGSAWGSPIRYIPYLEVISACNNVRITDIMASMYSPISAVWRWWILLENSGDSFSAQNTGSLSAGQTILDQAIKTETASQYYDTGPLPVGAKIFPCLFDIASTTGSLVLSNVSWKAVSS